MEITMMIPDNPLGKLQFGIMEASRSFSLGLIGREKMRICFEGDTTHRFALSVLAKQVKGQEGQEVKESIKNKCVPLQLADGTYWLEISSIAKRLKLTPEQIQQFKNNSDSLLHEIVNTVKNYTTDMTDIKNRINIFRASIDSNIIEVTDFKTEKIANPELNALWEKFAKKFKQATTFEAKKKILDDFESSLPPDKPIKIGPKINLKFDNQEITNGKLNLDTKQGTTYMVELDGKLYPSRPKADTNYVPYKLDDMHWVRVNINSLRESTGLDREAITGNAQTESGLEAVVSWKLTPNTKAATENKIEEWIPEGYQQLTEEEANRLNELLAQQVGHVKTHEEKEKTIEALILQIEDHDEDPELAKQYAEVLFDKGYYVDANKDIRKNDNDPGLAKLTFLLPSLRLVSDEENRLKTLEELKSELLRRK
jgi:hypothetical protein